MKIDGFLKNKKVQRQLYDVILIHIDSFYNTHLSYFNMGLLSMATLLKQEGFKVRCLSVFDLYKMSPTRIRQIFKASKPAIVGFYTLTDNIYQVQEFATKVKKWSPDTYTLVGGPLATSLMDKIMEYPDFDGCVVGEGEYPLLSIAKWRVRGEGVPADVKGLIYRKKDGLVFNPPDQPIKNLDELPLPDHSLIGHKVNFHVVSGRGCPYNCIFCFQGVHGLKYRYRDADKVADEIINNLTERPYTGFDIIDDTFIANPARVKKIAERLEEYRNRTGREYIFFCQGRVDIIDKHPEMLEQLKKAGLIRLQVGLESGDPDMLKIYDKKINIEQIKRVVKRVVDIGDMTIVGNFILGGPFENEKSFQATLKLNEELLELAPGVFEMSTAFMGPYPGTPIAEFPEKYGLKVVDREYKKGLTLSDVGVVSDAFDLNAMRMLDRRYEAMVMKKMTELIPKISHNMMINHFEWSKAWGLQTFWYQLFLSKREALARYFDYAESPRFSPLMFIPPHEILDWHPQRVMEHRLYSRDGRQLLLPETTGKYRLRKPEEILVYELSSGKLSLRAIIGEYIRETGTDMSEADVLTKVMLPLFRKLEKTYHIIFYK